MTNHNVRKWVLIYLHKSSLIALSFPVNERLAFDFKPNYNFQTKLPVILLFHYPHFVLPEHLHQFGLDVLVKRKLYHHLLLYFTQHLVCLL